MSKVTYFYSCDIGIKMYVSNFVNICLRNLYVKDEMSVTKIINIQRYRQENTNKYTCTSHLH